MPLPHADLCGLLDVLQRETMQVIVLDLVSHGESQPNLGA